MELKETIKTLAENSLPSNAFFIVDVKITGKSTQQKVLITMDGDNGVSIDDCAALNRVLGENIELDALFEHPFNLEISSPGADETIQNSRQYLKNIGRTFEIVNEDDELTIGQLKGITEDGIVIIPETKKKKKQNKDKIEEEITLSIPHSKIKKSNVIISFK